jgi:hypothetical protein
MAGVGADIFVGGAVVVLMEDWCEVNGRVDCEVLLSTSEFKTAQAIPIPKSTDLVYSS